MESERLRDHIDLNRKAWDDIARYSNGAGRIALQVPHLTQGLANRRVLHMQCGRGEHTVALARSGADVTGIDFSSRQIEAASAHCRASGVNASFLVADIHDLAVTVPAESFDIVWAVEGVMCWVGDLERWARGIYHTLGPGGELVLCDVHPIAAVFEIKEGHPFPARSYFGAPAMPRRVSWRHQRKSADDSSFTSEVVTWDWPLSNILQSLISAGLVLSHIEEFPECGDIYRWQELDATFRGRLPGHFVARCTKIDLASQIR